MLVGQYDYAIDAKGRLNFPAKFRDAMGETFIVTRWLDHCLAAFPSDEFEKRSPPRSKKKGWSRAAAACSTPPLWRRRTSRAASSRPPACEHAGLDHDVTVIGKPQLR